MITQEQIDKLKSVGFDDVEIENIKKNSPNGINDKEFDELIDFAVKREERRELVRLDTEKHKKSREEIEKTPGGYVLLQKNSIHQKFINANVMFMASGNLPYYGEFNQYINFHQAKIGTCGVNVSDRGMNFYWDPDFVEGLLQNELNFITIHEDCHLLFDHIKRSVGYDKKVSNLVHDMLINQTIYDEIMSKPELKEFIDIPKNEKGENTALFIPIEYPGMYISEELYEWFMKKYREHRQKKFDGDVCSKCGQPMPGQGEKNEDGEPQKNKGKGKGKGKKEQKEQDQKQDKSEGGECQCPECGQSKKPDYGQYGKNGVECGSLESIFDALDRGEELTLDVHMDDQIPEELRKEIVGDIVNKMKARGLETGDMTAILNRLRKSKKDYLKQIKRAIASDIFGTNKSKTITRPNRRSIWGLKGNKKYNNCINVILDTSGSMGGSFEKVLSYIFQNDVQINMIQVDTQVNDYQVVKNKKDLERLRIMGLGGTRLQPGLDYIADPKNNLNKYNTVVLGDGFCDSLDFSKIRGRTLILTIGNLHPITFDNGRIKQIKIEKDE